MTAIGLLQTVIAAALHDPSRLQKLQPPARRAIVRWMETLTEADRTVVLGLYAHGRSVDDVAFALQIHGSEVAALRRNALSRLARAVAAEHRAEVSRRDGGGGGGAIAVAPTR